MQKYMTTFQTAGIIFNCAHHLTKLQFITNLNL